MQHVVYECLTHFNGRLEALHLAEQDAVLWLGTQCKAANAKKKMATETQDHIFPMIYVTLERKTSLGYIFIERANNTLYGSK